MDDNLDRAAQPAPQPIATIVGGQLVVDTSPLKGLLVSSVTGLLRVAGAVLVAHGVATDGMVDGIIPAAAQDIVGTAFVCAGQAWAWWREHRSHSKIIAAAQTESNRIVFK